MQAFYGGGARGHTFISRDAVRCTRMIRLAANLSTLFTELPFLERFAAAAQAGFKAVECQFPYEAEPEVVAARLRATGLQWVLFNGPPGNAGERGLASLPGREREFDAGIELAARYVAAADCRCVHVMAGLLPAGADRARYLDTYIAAIGRAADRLAQLGVTVLIEAINTRVDVPGYLLDS